MKDGGLLFTLGVAFIGGILFSFATAYSLASKKNSDENALAALERAQSQAANVAYGIGVVFRRDSGISVRQSEDGVSLSGTLPNRMTGYVSRVKRLAEFSKSALAGVDVRLDEPPTVVTAFGVNFTQIDETTSEAVLPYDATEVAFAGETAQDAGGCSVASEPGRLKVSVDVRGNPPCAKEVLVNGSGKAFFDLSGDGKVTMALEDGLLTVKNTGVFPLNYTLTVVVNESRLRPPPKLGGVVSSEVLGCVGRSEVLL